MRHKHKRATVFTSWQKQSNVMRNLITSLVDHGQIITTWRKARALKARADALFGKLVQIHIKYDGKNDAKRELSRLVKRVVYTEDAGKKLVQDFVPKWADDNKTSGFVRKLKLGPRPWDNAEKFVVSLI